MPPPSAARKERPTEQWSPGVSSDSVFPGQTGYGVKTMYEPAPRDEAVPIAVQLLRRACLALDADACTARREIHRALALLVDSVTPAPFDQPVHGLAPWQARRVVDHVLAHLETPIRVEDLADVTRLSTSHFSRAFKLSFRMSPHAYVIALRLARARSLMLESDEQMSQIAAACGFADQAHFSRAFRRRVGCTPGLWRRERRGGPNPDPAATIGNPVGAEVLWSRPPEPPASPQPAMLHEHQSRLLASAVALG